MHPLMIKHESVGIPLVDTDCKVVDPETGREMPPDEVGELLWRGAPGDEGVLESTRND